MTDISKYLTESRGVYELYDNNFPLFEQISIHEIRFISHGFDILIIFDLAQFPSKVPKKWTLYNTIQIELLAIETKDLIFNSWVGLKPSDLIIVKNSDCLHVKLIGDDEFFSFRANFLSISKISAYKNDLIKNN
ncbi:MAG: hypothetical protein RL344_1489 [Pseudomonadota bacterium]|jgi:hypothetical protein